MNKRASGNGGGGWRRAKGIRVRRKRPFHSFPCEMLRERQWNWRLNSNCTSRDAVVTAEVIMDEEDKAISIAQRFNISDWKGSHSFYQLFSLLAANNGEYFKLGQTAAVTLSRWILGVNVLE